MLLKTMPLHPCLLWRHLSCWCDNYWLRMIVWIWCMYESSSELKYYLCFELINYQLDIFFCSEDSYIYIQMHHQYLLQIFCSLLLNYIRWYILICIELTFISFKLPLTTTTTDSICVYSLSLNMDYLFLIAKVVLHKLRLCVLLEVWLLALSH